MHWNYRVIRKLFPDSETYEIHEVYYADDCKIESWTKNPVKPFGETAAELRSDIEKFLQAFRHPILELREVDGKETLAPDNET